MQTAPIAALDFTLAANADGWFAIDDRVMGGVSKSHLAADPRGFATFAGEVSLERDGGFASVRSPPLGLDLSAFAGLVVDARGDGRRFRLNLRCERSFDGVLFRSSFETRQGEWTRVRLPFEGFEASIRGRRLPDAPKLDRARIETVGFLVADRQAGPFRLDVTRIVAYR